jgi:hypothetical protein
VSPLERLADKYARMLALRRRRDELEGGGLSAIPADERSSRRDELRRLARDFPGALRELDACALDVLERRALDVAAALRGGEPAGWIPVMLRFHDELRAHLGGKSRAGGPLYAEIAGRLGMTREALVEVLFGAVR